MGLALFKERRLTQRQRLTGLLPGRLVRKSDGTDLACKPIDVSRNGLGILLDKELTPGEEVTLMVRDNPIVLQVAWIQPDFGKDDQIRYGLVAVDPSQDVEQTFVQAGCIV